MSPLPGDREQAGRNADDVSLFIQNGDHPPPVTFLCPLDTLWKFILPFSRRLGTKFPPDVATQVTPSGLSHSTGVGPVLEAIVILAS